jgi:hypothetical protein
MRAAELQNLPPLPEELVQAILASRNKSSLNA